ncbi:prepilin-type N-terminal cleavage/methylation domain-containing protein [Acetoanaerobium pronyense]|uniref:Prepilin-type N-terminal cleavage/methylation domain-containing protein n=1 Tax=Acetoanaerobium pronyense TaxID=1482736 RepID=A0ABS4KHV3_9FIRM|nr:type II secretion system protein [Acetoanaerobium pronyense]MBP2027363.1 prepilin-type N-terminal cleavage/methylation domain-containing protein [Acetoanaerobium pronyense]
MMEKMRNRKKKKGFTLIELIVVIAILGILSAIAIPRFTGSRVTAERSSVEANLRTIDSAIMVMLAEGTDPTFTAGADGAAPTTNLVPNYLAAWPTGPKTAAYAITGTGSAARAALTSTADVGGKTFSTATTVENLAWPE